MDVAVGSLIAVNDTGHHWLGLVPNQSKAEEWARKDPSMEAGVVEELGPLLVRVLGLRLTRGRPHGGKGVLPEREPRQIETVRWAYIDTITNPPWIVAGPSLSSIEEFLRTCRLCNSLGMTEADFLYEVALIAEYLRGVTRTPDAISYFDRQYFAMLADILPR